MPSIYSVVNNRNFILFLILLFFIHRNRAISDYLASNGYLSALSEFQKETNMVSGKFLVCYMFLAMTTSVAYSLRTKPLA